MTLGFDQPWYILSVHQLESFQMTMFGWEGTLSAAQTLKHAAAKRVIYDGFQTLIACGTLKEQATIPVDRGEDYVNLVAAPQLDEQRRWVASSWAVGKTNRRCARE